MELTSQTGKWPVTLRLRTMTESARRNSGVGNSLFVDFFPGSFEFLWCPSNGFRIERPEMLGKSSLHRRTEELRHIAHDGMHAPVLNKGSQLIDEVFDLLSREPWYGRRAMKTLPRWLMADLALFDLGLKVSRRGRKREFERCEHDALGYY